MVAHLGTIKIRRVGLSLYGVGLFITKYAISRSLT